MAVAVVAAGDGVMAFRLLDSDVVSHRFVRCNGSYRLLVAVAVVTVGDSVMAFQLLRFVGFGVIQSAVSVIDVLVLIVIRRVLDSSSTRVNSECSIYLWTCVVVVSALTSFVVDRRWLLA